MSVDVAPLLAIKAPSMITEFLTPQPSATDLVIVLGLILGYIFFGIATVRAGVLPRGGAWLLIAGALLAFGGAVSRLIGIVAAAVFGAGLAWMGYALWSSKDESV